MWFSPFISITLQSLNEYLFVLLVVTNKNITTMKRFGFKTRSRSTGLASVGSGTPATDIFIGKPTLNVQVGWIDHNDSWNSRRTGITIHLKFKDEGESCGWKNVVLAHKPASLEDAKEFLNGEKVRTALYEKLYIK